MANDLFDVVGDCLLLIGTVGVVLWALLTAMTSSWLRQPVPAGLAVGALTGPLGPALVLLWSRLRHAPPPLAPPTSTPAAAAGSASGAPGSGTHAASALQDWMDEDDLDVGRAPPPGPAVWRGSTSGLPPTSSGAVPLALAATSVLVALGIAATTQLAWLALTRAGRVVVAADGSASPVLWVPLATSAALSLAAGPVLLAWPRRLLVAAVAMSSAWWTTVAGALLITTQALTPVVDLIPDEVRGHGRVELGRGPLVLLLAAVAGLIWCTAAAAWVHRSDNAGAWAPHVAGAGARRVRP